ncbi:hypothetical protein CLV62_10810 [Dysgonomonas alginatilytica]|uniref:Uncharacterized protein n=1 Tax=Dysgonomonas alginatilytica TaxID=1605892 RepID=A0A2V3PPH3_9BACT|nr:hypothetical protein [Dysgonomonas alginatilytica]PXV65012.1 hypothetical protein CLV62_10810 [Dysgonomonas alginatilytica]
MKKILTVVILFAFIPMLFAQTNTDKQKEEINKIKKSKNYIYGEATLPNQEEALKLAKEILVNNINEWVSGEKKIKQSQALVIRDIIENSENISLVRGNMYRAFVYVQKKNILPVEDTDNSVIISRPVSTDADQALIVQGIHKTEPKRIETTDLPLTADPDDTPQDILNKITGITQFKDAAPYFQELKNARKMVYGKLKTMTSPNDCYLLIYNPEGAVVAILDKGHLKNLNTRTEDSLSNYKGCGALWFQLF